MIKKTKVLFIFLVILSGYARILNAQNQSLSPYFHIRNADTAAEQFPLLSTSAVVQIAGVIADVKVRQRYVNRGNSPIEATYVFPGSTNAAVYDMVMRIGKRRIKAQIKEKGQAKELYGQAKQAGKSASLLEQNRPNVFQMNVANILPGDTIQVELFYTEWLTPKAGEYEFVYPTVVGPRFSQNPPKGVLTANFKKDQPGIPYTKQGAPPSYLFDFSLNINAGMPIRKAECLSHKVSLEWHADECVSMHLANGEQDQGNKDVIIQYSLRGDQIEDGLLTYEGKDENFFLLMLQPPVRPKVQSTPPREYIFIMDVSGSMGGLPLDVSKKMMENLLSTVSPNDQFNILAFSGSAGFLAEHSIPATPPNVEYALNSLTQLKGGGGTRMLDALEKAMHTSKLQGYARSFVILTDGYIDFEASVFDYIRQHLGKANFFPFGIGSGVNRHLIEGIAHVGNCEPFVVTDNSPAYEIADQFKTYIETPVLTNIQITFDQADVYDLTPNAIPDLMADRPILVFGKYKGKLNGQITVKGQNANGSYVKKVKIDKTATTQNHKALQYLWARHRLKSLSDYFDFASGADRKIKQEQILKLGLQYNLLTPFTAFIAIDDQMRNPNTPTKQVPQALPLPDGVQHSAVGSVTEMFDEEEYLALEDVEFVDLSIDDPFEAPRSAIPPPPPPPPEPIVEEIFRVSEEMPLFPGCHSQGNDKQKQLCSNQKLMAFIYNHLKWPHNARNSTINGTIVIQFVVEKDGTITNIKIIRDIGFGFGQEAKRVIKLMAKQYGGKWIPGKQRGRPVSVQMNIPIRFNIK